VPSISDVVGSVAGMVSFCTLVLLAVRFSPAHDAAGRPINILWPGLWDDGFIYVFVGLLLLTAAFVVSSRYRQGLASAATAVGMLASGLVVWAAATDRVLNPSFAAAMGWNGDAVRWTNNGLIIAAALAILGNAAELVLRLRRR
jgi:hypothetical protein